LNQSLTPDACRDAASSASRPKKIDCSKLVAIPLAERMA
jgi:hypothetical protein